MWFIGRKRSSAGNAGTLIVRRGLDAAYYYFLSIYTRANALTMVIDRRRHDRRAASSITRPERRSGDRRGPSPETWAQGDFVLIPPRHSPEPATPPIARTRRIILATSAEVR